MKILVIADDLSGATELAGIAWRYGLSTLIAQEIPDHVTAKVLCLDTNTRAASEAVAIGRIEAILADVRIHQFDIIFKKIDSVLRGHLIAEITPFIRTGKCCEALLLPANPSRGRTIRNGCYTVQGVPLNQTAFAEDPIFPRYSERVQDYLFPNLDNIIMPDIATLDDITLALAQATSNTLLVGAADAFERVIHQTQLVTNTDHCYQPTGSALFICGSLAALQLGRSKQAQEHGVATLFLRHDDSPYLNEASNIFNTRQALQIAMPIDSQQTCTSLYRLTQTLIHKAIQIINQLKPQQIYVEGGATARALLDELNIKTSIVKGEIAPGIVAIEASECGSIIVIKPGSYPWPDDVWTIASVPS